MVGEAVQMPAECPEIDSVVVFSGRRRGFHSVSTGYCELPGQPSGKLIRGATASVFQHWRSDMRHKRIVIGCVVAIVFLVFYYFYGGSTVPSGQQPLVRISASNLASLKDAFNRSGDSLRLLVLVSPT